jgi:membrane protein YqaA with SNARE-associated domain
MKKLKNWLNRFLNRLEHHASKPWYPFAAAAIALVDNFLFVVPIAALLITSVFAAPKHWKRTSFWVTLGSAIGAVVFAIVIRYYGISIIESFFPHLMKGAAWRIGDRWINDYGLWALFFVEAIPITDHPLIALAALTALPMPEVAGVIVLGKSIKFFTVGWIASHSPKLLLRFKRIEHDVMGIEETPGIASNAKTP